MSLTESVRNIEISLSKRTEEERLNLSIERDSLLRALEGMRKRESDQVLVDDQRFKSLEEDLRVSRMWADERAAEVAVVKEELLRSEGVARAVQERCNVLEKQLALAQERLESVQGSQTMDMILQREAADREIALTHALSEVASLRNQLLAEKVHAEEFQKISASTEATLKKLQRQSHEAQTSSEQGNASLRVELKAVSAELSKHRQDCLRYIEELDEAKRELRECHKENAEHVRSLNAEYALAKCAADNAVERESALKADIIKCQQETREARTIYLREMDIHVKEAKARDEMEKELHITKSSLDKSLQASAELSANLIRQERLVADEKAKSEEAIREMRDKMCEVKAINDALHTQLESLGSRVARAEEIRSESFQSAAASISTSAEGSEDAGLRRSVDQMILLLNAELKRAKQERELSEGKLSVSESENASQAQILIATQRALDEVRALLHRGCEESKNNSPVDLELDRLRSENGQLNIIRESNAHLRAENEDLARSNASLRSSLQSAKAVETPLEERIRRLTAEKEALETSNAQLDTDRGFWKEKVTNILSRYNDIDPDEHNALKDKVATAMGEIAETKAAMIALTAEMEKKEAELSTRDKEQLAEISSAKNLVQSLEKTADNFRNKMRKVLEEKAQSQETVKTLEAAKEELLKQGQEQKEQLDRLQAQLLAVQTSPVPTQLALTSQQLKQQQAGAQQQQKAKTQAQVVQGMKPVPTAIAAEVFQTSGDVTNSNQTLKRRRDASPTPIAPSAHFGIIAKEAGQEAIPLASAAVPGPRPVKGAGKAPIEKPSLAPASEGLLAPTSTLEIATLFAETVMDTSVDRETLDMDSQVPLPMPVITEAESSLLAGPGDARAGNIEPAVSSGVEGGEEEPLPAVAPSVSSTQDPEILPADEPENVQEKPVTAVILGDSAADSDRAASLEVESNVDKAKMGTPMEGGEKEEDKANEDGKEETSTAKVTAVTIVTQEVDTMNLLKEQLLKKKLATLEMKVAPVNKSIAASTIAAKPAEMEQQKFTFGSTSSSMLTAFGTAQLAQPGGFPAPRTAGLNASPATSALNAAASPFTASSLGGSKPTPVAPLAALTSASSSSTAPLPSKSRGKTRGNAVVPPTIAGSIFGAPAGSGFAGLLAGMPAKPLFSTLPTSLLNKAAAFPLKPLATDMRDSSGEQGEGFSKTGLAEEVLEAEAARVELEDGHAEMATATTVRCRN